MSLAAMAGLAAAFLLPGADAAGGELGAFIATAAVSAYEQGPRQGSRVPLRPGTAYAVVGLTWEREGRAWLKLSTPERQQSVRGEGWTPLTAEELAAQGTAPVEIYPHPVELGATTRSMASSGAQGALPSAAGSVHVPASDIQSRSDLPAKASAGVSPAGTVVWRPVRYAVLQAAHAWVQASRGIYRPNRTPGFLKTAYQNMSGKRVPAETLRRLLAGVVRAGDSAQDARWAWGEPLRTRTEGPEGQRQAIWEYDEGQLRFSGAAILEVR